MLAFSRLQLASFGDCADIVVADELIDPCAETLRVVGKSSETIRMFLAQRSDSETFGVHAHLSLEMSPTRVVAQALALIELRHRAPSVDGPLCWGPLQLDVSKRESRWRGGRIDLTATQFEILAALVRAGGHVLTKLELQREVWPDSVPDDGERLIAHIRRIRARIESDPSRPQFLLTARGVGFRLADPSAEPRRNLTLVYGEPPAFPQSAGRIS